MRSGSSVFVDSTTVLYVKDPTEPVKSPVCAAWLKALQRSGALVLNRQVLNEVYAALIRKPKFRTDRPAARAFVSGLERWSFEAPGAGPARTAWVLEDRFGVQFYDALLLAAAAAARCRVFLTEDLNDGQDYAGVAAVNPFRHAPEDVLGRALRT